MNEREHFSGWIWKARSGRSMPASNRLHMMFRMDRRIFLRELGGAGATVLAGCTGSTAGDPRQRRAGLAVPGPRWTACTNAWPGTSSTADPRHRRAGHPGPTMSTSTSSAHAHWRLAHPRPSGAPFNLKIVRGAA
jgi:hypothetical protein